MRIPVLYQDEDVVAVSKPEGLASIPERSRERSCLLELVTEQLAQRLYVVHRLDKDASGVMLFARNPRAHKFLNDQFAAHSIRKSYLALVHGIVAQDSGTITAPLRQFGSGRTGVDQLRGKSCLTDFSVSDRLGQHTLLSVEPWTGRRHQVRVHLYSLGHPIVGDRLYGDRTTQSQFSRLMLHAFRLGGKLPSGQEMEIEAPPPESFAATVARFKQS
jgi:RluA family pseudouridine synthase